MAFVLIPVGLPGSGKTTKLKEHALRTGAIYICPDEIRLELLGNMMDQTFNKEVWEIVYHRTRSALLEGHSVVLDATNVITEFRRQFIKFCRDVGGTNVDIQLWIFFTPVEECFLRNRKRNRTVPEDAMNRMVGYWNESLDAVREEGGTIKFIF